MDEGFDPYHEWLGIPPRHQPPHHYRLLGVDIYESNADVIRRSLKRQTDFIDSLQKDEDHRFCDQLLSELNAAAQCLLDPELRANYDRELRTAGETDSFVVEPRRANVLPRVRRDLSVHALARLLDECGLVSRRDLAEIQRGQGKNGLAKDAKTLAERLVHVGRLTPYQSEVLLSGSNRGLVLGHYIITEHIGSGGMGEVFKGLHREMQRHVAIKILQASATESLNSIDNVKRFQREVKAAARLHHPNIVTAYDAGECDGLYYLVMELVDGVDLRTWVEEQGPCSIDDAVRCIFATARGLRCIHNSGVVHRDIKPANLMLTREKTIKVLDLSVATLRNESLDSTDKTSFESLTSFGQILGTAQFMSPEQAIDPLLADRRADIYSLGCTLYFLLTGKPPFQTPSLRTTIVAHQKSPIPQLQEEVPNCPNWLNDVFQQMLAKRPSDRFETAHDLMVALRNGALAKLSTSTAKQTENVPNRSATLSSAESPAASDGSEQPQTEDEGIIIPQTALDREASLESDHLPVIQVRKASKVGEASIDTEKENASPTDVLPELGEPFDDVFDTHDSASEMNRFLFYGVNRKKAEWNLRLSVVIVVLTLFANHVILDLLIPAVLEKPAMTLRSSLNWMGWIGCAALILWFTGIACVEYLVKGRLRNAKVYASSSIRLVRTFRAFELLPKALGAAAGTFLIFNTARAAGFAGPGVGAMFIFSEAFIGFWYFTKIIRR